MTGSEPRWVADPGIRWRILLSAQRDHPLAPAQVQAGLDRLAQTQGWPTRELRIEADLIALRAELAEVSDAPVAVGISGQTVVVSCHHAFVDGLGLLDVLGSITGTTITSGARGVDNRPGSGSFVASLIRRLVEVVATPPSRVAGRGAATGLPGDLMLHTVVPRALAPADLVWSAASGISAHNQRAGQRTRHVAVAVGAGRRTPQPDANGVVDRSALIRLRDLEGLDRDEVRARLRAAPLVPRDGQGPGGGRVVLSLMRLLSRRLGSTLLVSHLGEVDGDGWRDLAFYPVTAGGTGLSLGAVSGAGRTMLTLRGRASDWTTDGLRAVLDSVAAAAAGTD